MKMQVCNASGIQLPDCSKLAINWKMTMALQFLSSMLLQLPSAKISPIPFFTPKHTFFTSNDAIFNPTTHTHFFTLFNKKIHKNRYTRKQPTHFSMTP